MSETRLPSANRVLPQTEPEVTEYGKVKRARATQPQASLWLTANAGSGKTYMLAWRVIRLMLKGAKPGEILCLTFTNAAAAQMTNRVFSILGGWATAEEETLVAEIIDLVGRKPSRAEIARARQLFALALDTPGGLKIQTIHAFCEALLHQFAIEATVPGRFELIDESDQAELLTSARRHVERAALGLAKIGPLAGRSAHAAGSAAARITLAECLDEVRNHASDHTVEKVITALLSQRDRFSAWLDTHGGVTDGLAPLWKKAGLAPTEDEAQMYARFQRESGYTVQAIDEIIGHLKGSTAGTAKDRIMDFERLKIEANPERAFEIRRALLLTTKDKELQGIISRKFTENLPPAPQALYRSEQQLILKQLGEKETAKALRASEALFTLVDAILFEYARLKRARGLLDFSDVIARTRDLLAKPGIGDWVRYKLDYGISHVLVDEAQDTSPAQWDIINAISEDFFAGDGARSGDRTMFVVGDEKQSIYSFQGADIGTFFDQRRAFTKRVAASGQNIPANEQLELSYRSTSEVLSAVDQVFSLPQNADGVTGSDFPPHPAKRFDAPGDVILWDLIERPEKPSREEWPLAVDEQGQDAEVALAERIARTVKTWIDKREIIAAKKRPIHAGDVLILVRKRTRFVNAMIRALKAQGLPTAGADRLKLTDHIAIEDMVAIGRFAAGRVDELALAGVLKSPIFGFDEEDLFELCHGRSADLYSRLAGDEPLKISAEKREKAVRILNEALKVRGRLPVYEFYARLFSKFDLRKAYRARHGHEVEEVLDAFFDAAMEHDHKHGTDVLSFVEMLEANERELKREIDAEAKEVRVITAHASKGLEAPIVFLVDPGSAVYNQSFRPPIAWIDGDHVSFPMWCTNMKVPLAEAFYQAEQLSAEQEYRRLLYVGMTRAEDRLILCGYEPNKKKSDDIWHRMAERGLQAALVEPRAKGRLEPLGEDDPAAPGLRWVIDNPARKGVEYEQGSETATQAEPDLPAWASKAPREQAPPRPLSPSGVAALFDLDTEKGFANADGQIAMARGTVIHHLLQALPDIAKEKRASAIETYFSHPGFSALTQPLDQKTRDRITADVIGLLEQPFMEPLLATGSLGEAEIAGSIEINGTLRPVRGKIDRLAFKDDEVLIADYKSGAYPPAREAEVTSEYMLQMALYRRLLAEAYPGKAVRAWLIWTANASAIELSGESLDTALEALTDKP